MTRTYCVEKLNVPNRNGRIYTTELMESVLNDDSVKESLKCKTMLVSRNKFGDSEYVEMSDVCGVVTDIRIEDDCLVVNADVFDWVTFPHAIRLCGIGNVEENGVVSDYELNHFILTEEGK